MVEYIMRWLINQSTDRVHCARSCFPLCPSDVTLCFWKKVLDDPLLMHIKLSISASHRTAIFKASGASPATVQQLEQDTIRFRLGTMKSLQKMFENGSKIYLESTVFMITHLVISEVRVLHFLLKKKSLERSNLLTKSYIEF